MLINTLIYLVFITDVFSDSVEVELRTGVIQGTTVVNPISGNKYYSFKQIDYALPPLGNDRFQAPQEQGDWNVTIKIKSVTPFCYQHFAGGSEDCIHLNVFTTVNPNDSKTTKLQPVMFFIHGGAFVHGSSKLYTPDFLIDHGVILVTINYRLNVFGFLNTLDNSVSANAGLKDLVAGLKWVRTNIEKFGGDPNKVTIFGHSAGGASVQYLMQSKLAKGLFHRAIALSGSTLNKWSFQKNPLDKARKLGTAIGLNTENTTELVEALKELSEEDLFKKSTSYAVMGKFNPLKAQPFVPSLEIDTPDAFLTDYSYDSLKNNKLNNVPFMTGYVTNEAGFFNTTFEAKSIDIDQYKNDIMLLLPPALNISMDSDKKKLVMDEIIKYFFQNEPVTNLDKFFNYQSQELFVRGITKSVELMRKYNQVYFYKFSYDNKEDKSGVIHAEELKYIFNFEIPETEQDKKVREQFTKLLTNFAKTGNPTPEDDQLLDNIKWPVVTQSGKTNYLNIGDSLKVEENREQDKFDFWEKLFEKYANPPYYIW